jgi:hypothetical protein
MRKEFQLARDVILGSTSLPQEDNSLDIFQVNHSGSGIRLNITKNTKKQTVVVVLTI